MDHAFAYVEKNGLELESAYPYTATDGTCEWDKSKAQEVVKGYTDVDASADALKQAVSGRPVSVGVAANSAWQMYSGGVVSLDDCPNGQLDHGVVLVGYNAEAWIVRNSWGPSWGESGYIRLAVGDNTCGILNTASYPTF